MGDCGDASACAGASTAARGGEENGAVVVAGPSRPRRQAATAARLPGLSSSTGRNLRTVVTNYDPVALAVPTEVMMKIFALLDMTSLIRVGQVCCQWRIMSRDHHHWKNTEITLTRVEKYFGGVDGSRFRYVCFNYVNERFWDYRNSIKEWQRAENLYPNTPAYDGTTWCRDRFINDPAHRHFFFVLRAAPFLRQLCITLDQSLGREQVDQILAAQCRVHTLYIKSGQRHLDEYARLVEGLRDSVEELRFDALVPALLPVVARMPRLKVLRFTDLTRTVRGANWNEVGPIVFPPLAPEGSSLLEFRATGMHTAWRTVCSALKVHADTLRVAQFHCTLSVSIVQAIATCPELRELHIRCQGHMDRLTTATPNLQRLVLMLDCSRDDPVRLRSLPTNVRDLVLLATARMSLQRDLEGLVQGCRALPQLRSITIHYRSTRRQIQPEAHRVFLLDHFPRVRVSFVGVRNPEFRYRHWYSYF